MPTFRHFKTIVKLRYFPSIYSKYYGNAEDIQKYLKISPTTFYKLQDYYKDQIFPKSSNTPSIPQPIIKPEISKEDLNKFLSKFELTYDIFNTRISNIENNKNQISEPKEIVIKIIIKNEISTTDKILPAEFERIVALAQARMNILLVGPAGCGKTHIANTVAEVLNLPFYSLSVSAGMSESQLAGWLVPTGEGGRFEYRRSSFIKCYEEGGVFLLDEIDAGDSNTLVFINAALANGSCPVPNRTELPSAKRHKDFICIAAANTFGNGADRQYVGRNQLDAATLDRFRVGTISMNYDSKVEEALVDFKILTWGRRVRGIISNNKMRRIVSTRFLKDLTIMSKNFPEMYGSEREWVNILTQDWSIDEKGKISLYI